MYPLGSLLTAFISPACHAMANVCDSRFGKLYENQVTFLIALSKLIQFLLLIPIVLIFQPSLTISYPVLLILVIVVALEYLYVYPYFWALQHADTSVVAALFSLGKIIVPLLAWLFLHEVLAPSQYLGFVIIIFSTLLLTFNWRQFHLNRAALCMLLASLLGSVSTLFEKQAFLSGVPWATFTVLSMSLEGLLGLILLAATPKTTLYLLRAASPSTQTLFGLEGLLSGTGNAGSLLALSLLPVTVTKGISSSQPLFVLIYAKLFGRRFPGLFAETKSNLPLPTKIVAFALMILGTLLTLL